MLTIATTFVLALVLTIPTLSPFMIPIACAFTALIAVGTFSTASACYINIIEKTAAGADIIEDWPEFGIIDWLLESLYVVSSFTICAVPAVLAIKFVGDVAYVAEACMAGGFLLFPIVLLSMLDSNSTAVAYAPAVWGSLLLVPLGWFKFYLETSPLGAMLVAACLYVPHGNMWINAAFFLGSHISFVLYARLVGRLAWYIAFQQKLRDNIELSGV
jgi:hypothetical protein